MQITTGNPAPGACVTACVEGLFPVSSRACVYATLVLHCYPIITIRDATADLRLLCHCTRSKG